MPFSKFLLFFLPFTTLVWAQADSAAREKQLRDLERRESRERQKIDQAEEQERIKLRTRERDELAKVQLEATAAAGTTTAAVVATGSLAVVDTDKLAKLKLAQDEVHNLIDNQLGADISARYEHERNALTRKYNLERAKLEAEQIDAGDDTAKQRDRAIKTAEINAKFQEQLDDLALAEANDTAKLRFTHTTKINTAESDLAALTSKLLFAQSGKNTTAGFNLTANPDFIKLSAARDQAKSMLETALDELRASYRTRHTDIDNAKEDELAKLTE